MIQHASSSAIRHPRDRCVRRGALGSGSRLDVRQRFDGQTDGQARREPARPNSSPAVAGDDRLDDHPGLADYWRRAEAVWREHRRSDAMELIDRQDYHRGLSGQFPIPPTRVVYSKAGIRLAAAVVRDDRAVIDHKLYWATAASIDEARYLVAILNTAELTERVRPYQARGEFGPRDFDKYVFHVPIPLFDPANDAHVALVQLAARAETVATTVGLEGVGFQRARQLVREAFNADGVGGDLEQAVRTLLDRAY